ncbi:MAG TPA: hypothetical protein VF544_04265 [Pyrinomonadaceae bacterium]
MVKFWTPEGASAHLREAFSWSTIRLLRQFNGGYPAPEQLVFAVLGEFNLLIEGPCLYDERRFGGVELTDEARRLLKGTTEALEKIRLNRLLLEALYWPAVARSKGCEQNIAILLRRARLLMAGKAIHGETDGEAHFTPADVVKEAIAMLADGRAIWEPEKSKFMTFACLVMRSYVDHELNKSGNKIVESMSRPLYSKDGDGSSAEDETCFSDAGAGRKACEQAAEFADIMEMFPEDSLERKFLEVIGRGKGNEKLPDVAAELGVCVKEVRKAKANVERVLIQTGYFKRRAR